jgi:hypothetical protein
MLRRTLTAAVVVALLAAFAAGSAIAGETTGNFGSTTSKGKNNRETPIGQAPENAPHAQSICSFSGQNPERFLPETIVVDGQTVPNPDYEPGRTQSWGQIPKAVRDTLPSFLAPGSSCNGHTGFSAGGGSE